MNTQQKQTMSVQRDSGYLMQTLILWINNNKLKFLIFDNMTILVNIIIYNFVHHGHFIDFALARYVIMMNILFGVFFSISKIWIWLTNKYDIILRLDSIEEVILHFALNFFIPLNAILIVLLWFQFDDIVIFIFAIPWIIVICVNAWK